MLKNKNKHNIKEYIKSYWYVWLILFLILIIPIIVFICFFKNNLWDPNIWVAIMAGTFSYVGSCFLSAFVYYLPWKQNLLMQERLQPLLDISISTDYKNKVFTLYNYTKIKDNIKTTFIENNAHIIRKDSDFKYCKITLKNLSDNRIKSIKPSYYLTIENEKFIKNYLFICGLDNNNFPISYKEETSLYFGVDKKNISGLGKSKKHIVLRFVFYILDEYDKKYPIIVDAILGNTLGTGSKYINESYLDRDADFPCGVSNYYKEFL